MHPRVWGLGVGGWELGVGSLGFEWEILDVRKESHNHQTGGKDRLKSTKHRERSDTVTGNQDYIKISSMRQEMYIEDPLCLQNTRHGDKARSA